MEEEPFCPDEKNSSASRTSVLWRCRISTASLSSELAITPNIEKNIACRSRGIICVETGSILRPSFSATCLSTSGSMLANVPTGPEIAHVAISFLANIKRSLFR